MPVHTTAFGVRTRPVAERLKDRVARFHADRRLAFVSGDGRPIRLQLGRIAAIGRHRVFATRPGALAWLLG